MSKLTTIISFAKVRWGMKFTSRRKLEAYQLRRLQRHYRFLTRHSSQFQSLPALRTLNDLNNWPTMDKATMMDNFNVINTVHLDRDSALERAIDNERARDFTQTYKGLSVGLSSGTSGHRGLFVVSDKEREQWAGVILAHSLPKGKLLGHRVAFFLRADNNLYQTVGSKILKFRYFDIYNPMAENLAALADFQPTILVAPPSVLRIIAQQQTVPPLAITPQKVIAVAEVLGRGDTAFLKKAFGVAAIHQIYQCTEGYLAHTCEKGIIHLNEDIVVFEKERIGGRRFVPIITDFSRTSQPIIRYRLNDILIERKTPCTCGSALTAIDRIEGREGDILSFHTPSGTEVRVFSDMIERCMIYASGYRDYRVVQVADDHLNIYIDSVTAQTKRAISAEFRRLATRIGIKEPRLTFKPYKLDLNKKLRRVQRELDA